jgi:spoIIIJ-associated protein
MSQLRSIEVTAADIESAIEKGIAELGVSRDDVMVDVIEEPSRRLLGLGTRQARVRLTVIRAPEPPPAPVVATPAPSPVTDRIPDPIADAEEEADAPQRPRRDSRPRKPRTERPDRPAERPAERVSDRSNERSNERSGDYDFEDEDGASGEALSEQDLAQEAQIGKKVLETLLGHMGLSADVIARSVEAKDGEAQHWLLEIRGRNLGALIGRKGETLSSLQYITRLIASRELGRRAHLVIDVEGYKSRRETMLRRLAKRMADEAVQRGRTVSLEPMPPHERRIVHLTLKNNPNVTTESVGEGDRRKVTIVPRRGS